jgi:hypothetical protein
LIEDADPPLFKLNWKLVNNDPPPGSVLDYLYSKVDESSF